MMKRPYVSLSALSSPADVHAIRAAHEADSALVVPASHDVLLGISADRHTAKGELPAKPRKIATVEDIRAISGAITAKMPLAVHVETYYRDQPKKDIPDVLDFARYRTAPFADAVLRILDGTEPATLGALQLNGVVDPDELAKVHEAHPNLPIIYQLRRELLERGEEDVARHLRACRFAAAHVLLDLSSGLGVKLQPEECERLATLVREEAPDARIGIAGGIGAENVDEMYANAFDVAGAVSLDTETAIRETGTDAFSVPKSLTFLRNAYAAVSHFSATS